MQCQRHSALQSLFQLGTNDEETSLGVIGAGCSVATEATAEISHLFGYSQVYYFAVYQYTHVALLFWRQHTVVMQCFT